MNGALGPRPRSALWLHHRAAPSELRHIRRRVGQWAEQNRVPEDVLVDLQLALGEAVSNGMEHAYAEGEGGIVDVDVEIRRSAGAEVVVVQVVDHGAWRPVPTVGYRGRGLQLIERLSQRMEVDVTGSGTRVCFEIPLRS